MDAIQITTEMVGYLWGSPTKIQELVGRNDPKQPLIGELWMGVHPNAPSKLVEQPQLLLADFLKAHPRYLGELQEFPFLFKVMAFTQPLALQVHPNAEQAQKGFEKETARGRHRQLDKSLWNYQDPNPKAEMLVALSDCTVMCDFLRPERILENFKRLLPTHYGQLFNTCEQADNPIGSIMEVLYSLQGPRLLQVLAEYEEQLNTLEDEQLGTFLSAKQIAQLALAIHDQDVGVFSPFFLQVLHLKSGDAIFLKPGILHAYISGYGIELMTNSDNILRGGLTKKHCDTRELLSILTTEAKPVRLLEHRGQGRKQTYITDAVNEFSLSVYERGAVQEAGGSITLLFCTEGEAVLSKQDECLRFSQGQCVVIGASLTDYHLEVEGCLYCASYPKHNHTRSMS